MKLFSKSKVRNRPVYIVQEIQDLLLYFDSNLDNGATKTKKQMEVLCKLLREMKSILYGINEAEPVRNDCDKLSDEFFKMDILPLLVICLPKLNFEASKDATQVVANLQVKYRHIAGPYMEANMDLINKLVARYHDPRIALHYGAMLRGCICHQIVTKYVLENHLTKFFEYLQLREFEVSSDASATFRELLTMHKLTVASFLSENHRWFFEQFNTKLLRSSDYVTRRQAVKLLGDILFSSYNNSIMLHYVSSTESLKIVMALMKDSHACSTIDSSEPERPPSKVIQIEAFHVFKLFVANRRNSPEIVATLVTYRSELLHFIQNFKFENEFEQDKGEVLREIVSLF